MTVQNFIQSSATLGLVITLIGFQLGLLLKKRFKSPICNPLLFSLIFVGAFLVIFNISLDTYNSSAQHLTFLLTPATICLAVPLYQQLELLHKNWKAIFIGIGAGVIAGLSSVLFLSYLFSLSHQHYVTLLPKSITTAIGIDLSKELGGIVSLTVSSIIITGVGGNIIGETVLKLFRITHPVAKGLALGTASHAIGTAKALELGEVEGAMSSLAIVVTGILTVLAASFFAGLY